MTEQEWLICTNPQAMLGFLRAKASDRKLRLFACACCRLVWHRLVDPRSRQAVEVAERYADGLPSSLRLETVRESAAHAVPDLFGDVGDEETLAAAQAAEVVARQNWKADVVAIQVASITCSSFRRLIGGIERRPKAVREAQKAARQKMQMAMSHQAHLLRDLLGQLPFHPVLIEVAWLSWHDGLLISMAQRMYDTRDFADMPILADALEEAGCTDADILNHCRQPNEHMRGCWVVDLLLNKS